MNKADVLLGIAVILIASMIVELATYQPIYSGIRITHNGHPLSDISVRANLRPFGPSSNGAVADGGIVSTDSNGIARYDQGPGSNILHRDVTFSFLINNTGYAMQGVFGQIVEDPI